jgi:myo-inositol-1(or 4)-monophosphatase
MIDRSMMQQAQYLSPETGIAMEAARRGGEILLHYYQKLGGTHVREKARGDLVTNADLASEEAITEFLLREMPETGVQAEEGTVKGNSDKVWYIDPLDGTTNFVQKFPIFAVSIGLVDKTCEESERIRSGVVFNPISGDLFYAAHGKGSFYRGKRLSMPDKNVLSDAVIATGFPRRHHEELPTYLREFDPIFRGCRAIRRAGAAAMDLCWTAQGVFDGFWEHKLSPWDIAAGILMIEEAGGACSDFEGGRNYFETGNILGASISVHHELLQIIHSVRNSN